MLKRSLVYAVVVCVCSLPFCNISYAGTAVNVWSNAETKIYNAKETMEEERDNYNKIHDDLKTLIGEWDDNEQSNKDQIIVTVVGFGAAIVSVASGGSLVPATYVLLATGAIAMYKNASYEVNKSDYLASMSNLLPTMDIARANVNAAYNGGTLQKEEGPEEKPGYLPEYNAYLSMAVDHLNAYEYDTDQDYNTDETITFAVLEPAVKGGGTSGWHHEAPHDGDELKSLPNHVFTEFKTFEDFDVRPELPYTYECKGDGKELFRTPYEAFHSHRPGCDNYFSPDGTSGCGMHYYSCDTDYASQSEYHKVRICSKSCWQEVNGEWQIVACARPYRNCYGFGAQRHTFHMHSPDNVGHNVWSACSDQWPDGVGEAPTVGLSPSDPDQVPQPGESATLDLVTSEPYYNVSWYVKAPWESGDRGTYQEDTSGDGTSTTASFSYTFPSGAMHTGDFLITAVIYRWSDMSLYGEETCTITVDMTPDCDDCTDGSSDCPNASAH